MWFKETLKSILNQSELGGYYNEEPRTRPVKPVELPTPKLEDFDDDNEGFIKAYRLWRKNSDMDESRYESQLTSYLKYIGKLHRIKEIVKQATEGTMKDAIEEIPDNELCVKRMVEVCIETSSKSVAKTGDWSDWKSDFTKILMKLNSIKKNRDYTNWLAYLRIIREQVKEGQTKSRYYIQQRASMMVALKKVRLLCNLVRGSRVQSAGQFGGG